jgi:hypothetical protein
MKNIRTAWLALLCLGLAQLAQAANPPADGAAQAPADRAALEKQFAEKMSGATLVGNFTMTGKEESKGLKEERYKITKCTKLQDDFWVFQTRIQYGTHDATLPLTLKVLWAGDTPVITLTDTPVAGFGSFTCRVLIYGDRYSGTWQGGDTGGHLFGRIERTAEEK